jgi:hypothetical protein
MTTLVLELPVSRPASSKPTIAALAERFAPEAQSEGNGGANLRVLETMAGPPRSRGLPLVALVCIALVPTATLSVLLWQSTLTFPGGAMISADNPTAAQLPSSTRLADPEQGASALEIVLSGPDRIEAKAGNKIDFPIAIDTTGQLPPRSIIAISGAQRRIIFRRSSLWGNGMEFASRRDWRVAVPIAGRGKRRVRHAY